MYSVDDMVTQETSLIASRKMEIGKQYVKVGVKEPVKCDCASKIEVCRRILPITKIKLIAGRSNSMTTYLHLSRELH